MIAGVYMHNRHPGTHNNHNNTHNIHNKRNRRHHARQRGTHIICVVGGAASTVVLQSCCGEYSWNGAARRTGCDPIFYMKCCGTTDCQMRLYSKWEHIRVRVHYAKGQTLRNRQGCASGLWTLGVFCSHRKSCMRWLLHRKLAGVCRVLIKR